MSNDSRPTLHPALWVAAASVTAFSLAGLGAVTGLIPYGQKSAGPEAQVSAATTAPAPTTAPVPAPVAAKAAPGAVPHAAPVPAASPAPRQPTPRTVRSAQQGPADIEVIRGTPREDGYQIRTAAPLPPPAVCQDCGVVEAVRAVETDGDGSGLGAVAGGVLGGAVGNQIGRGRGNTLATIAGIVGGAYAGHQIEKAQKKTVPHQITVRFDDGSTRVVTQDAAPAWRAGDRVRVVNGVIAAAS